eukprot:CAMPEP_0197663114 /NCGR_PEP_ID=MMETSP1338-20131121/56147_1 /TAXON_ID=43686 ORGANISM="Pelagodinium beii, Strain RCC1491" /NCGR_SAMPLE_ID=MMETSP1338 /ASSEMBLY_ACC=CAM_ASM_000754 /LENGTH=352 /DNA_ID=CAMNT_0043241321 /DNA_START=34 /DNA_END=1092 /DNA_ORIENTATION=+
MGRRIQPQRLLLVTLIVAGTLHLCNDSQPPPSLLFCQEPSWQLRGRRPARRSGVKSPWDEVPVSFNNLADAKETLAHPDLFAKWGMQANEVLDLANVTVGNMLDLSSARQIASELGPLNVYLIGESGAGKSTLTLALADEVSKKPVPVKISAAEAGTMNNTFVSLPCGLVLVDTPGYRIPMAPTDEDQKKPFLDRVMLGYMYSRQLQRWQQNLRQLGRLVKETRPSKMPASAVMYVHKAGTRLVPERLVEALAVPIQSSVPTFMILSDIHAVDDNDMAEIRQVVSKIVAEVGSSSCGHEVQVLEVNSAGKRVQDVNFRASGLAELVAALLNALRPRDIFQFVRRASWATFLR